MPETLQELLARAAGFPEAGLRFLDRDERATWVAWPEIRQRAEEVAGGIKALGLARGERVGLVYPTSPEFVIAFFGVLAAGCVPAPLYPPVRLGRLAEYHQRTARLIQAVGAPLLLAHARVRRLLGQT